MSTVRIYQFTIYDISNDNLKKSRRWGTREAIARIGGSVLEETGVEVDASVLGRQMDGLSEIGFNPRAHTGLQNQVTT